MGRESETPEVNAGEQGAEQAKDRVVKVGQNLFKILVEEFPPDNQANAQSIVNCALFLACIVQNSFYEYKDRKDFIKTFTDTMEKNSNWLIAPVPEEPSEVKAP